MYLDYSLFPKMDRGYLIIPTPDAGLKEFGDLYDRFCSAIYMASKISDKPSKHILSNKAHLSSYARAALAEFAGIDEFICQNFEDINPNDYIIRKQPNPLFHIMKLLRNYNIHISESTFSERDVNVALPSNPDDSFNIKVKIINNLSAEHLKSLKSAKHYSIEEIQKMIDYFEKAQREFGVPDLLIHGVILYSKLISQLIAKSNIL